MVEICEDSVLDCQEAMRRILSIIDDHNDKSKMNASKNPYGTSYAKY